MFYQVNTVSSSKLSSKGGRPRLWIEGNRLTKAGFEPGLSFVIEEAKQGIVLKLADLGSNKVAKRERKDGRVDAIIDVTNQAALAPLQGCQNLRVVLSQGQIFVSAVASELRLMRRLNRLKERLVNGEALETAGIAAGGGILSKFPAHPPTTTGGSRSDLEAEPPGLVGVSGKMLQNAIVSAPHPRT